MSEPRTIFGRIRTFLIVSLITMMVWLLAESKMVQTQTIEPQIVLLSLDTEGSSLVVRQRDNQPNSTGSVHAQIGSVSVEIEGSAAGLDRFVRLVGSRFELRIGQEIPASPGIHTLDLRTILRQSLDFSVHGVVITQVTPATMSVEVDELITRDFEIRVDMPEGVELDGAPRTDPSTVRVIAPAGVFNGLDTDLAVVHVDSGELAGLTKGRRETIPDVAVEISGLGVDQWATQIVPAQVDVFVTLKTLSETMSIDRLPVQVLIAPWEIGKWLVEIDDADRDLVNVLISGPASAIELIRSGEVVPRAFVSMSFEELERRIQSKTAQILGLPPGCRVESPEFTVNLRVSPIESVTDGADLSKPDGAAGD